MVNDLFFDELSNLIYTTLLLDCPLLSGNMQEHIKIVSQKPNETVIEISAPSYDLKEWRKNLKIVHNYKYDYAVSVNSLGAFWGRSTKSKHWVNKSVAKSCKALGKIYNAEVDIDVEL